MAPPQGAGVQPPGQVDTQQVVAIPQGPFLLLLGSQSRDSSDQICVLAPYSFFDLSGRLLMFNVSCFLLVTRIKTIGLILCRFLVLST